MPFANPMGKLDSGKCNGRTPERLDACHRGAPAFDRPMILLDKIVEVLTTPHLNVLRMQRNRKNGTVALLALAIGVPERPRAKSARLRLPRATYYASARSQSCFNEPKFRYLPCPNANCLLRIRWASSIPANVIAALRKDLKPPMEAHRRLIAR